MDVPQKGTKEKKKRDRPPKEEKPDEVDNFLKKILKKQEPGIQQPARPVEKAEEKRAPQLTKETEMSEAEREKILAAVETHQEVTKDTILLPKIFKSGNYFPVCCK